MLNIPIDELTKQYTLHVHVSGYRRWLVRLAIANNLIRLAGWVAGMNVEFHFGGEDGLRLKEAAQMAKELSGKLSPYLTEED
jgi:hypothetical protein